jgi:hypothetical protein
MLITKIFIYLKQFLDKEKTRKTRAPYSLKWRDYLFLRHAKVSMV